MDFGNVTYNTEGVAQERRTCTVASPRTCAAAKATLLDNIVALNATNVERADGEREDERLWKDCWHKFKLKRVHSVIAISLHNQTMAVARRFNKFAWMLAAIMMGKVIDIWLSLFLPVPQRCSTVATNSRFPRLSPSIHLQAPLLPLPRPKL